MKNFFLILIAFCFASIMSIAKDQTNPCRKSTEGTDFWFGFMESRNYHSAHYLEITVTARENTYFTIYTGTGESFYSSNLVLANTATSIQIPWERVEATGSEEIQNKGIHLVSEKPVNVYALNYDNNSADVAVIYPVESIGYEYFAVCYEPNIHENNSGGYGNGRNSQFLVVAAKDSTEVLIIPSKVTDKLVNQGDSIIITLNKGEVYQVQSMNREGLAGQGDLTGSYILSDKPIAFFSGSLATTVPGWSGTSAWDHLYEQIPPVYAWGREYYAVPLASRQQDRYRIMAAKDGTTVNVDGQPSFTLDRGEYKEIVLYQDEPSRIFGDQPILVVQYSQSKSVDDSYTGGNGDPFMIVLSSTTQSKNDVTFVAYSSSRIKRYYVNILTLKEEIPNMRFNGSPMSASEFKDFPSGKYVYAQKAISAGTYRINNANKDRGFLAYVYGYGGVESYGYGVGFNLNLVLDLGESIDFEGDTLLLCAGETRTLDAGPYFDSYNWNTGDSSQTLEITDGGKYYVKTTTIDGCELEDSIFIFKSDPQIDLGNAYEEGCYPYSVKLNAEAGFASYAWLNQDNDTLSTAQTYTADQTGIYRIHAMNKYNCPARDTLELVVFPVPDVQLHADSLVCGIKTTTLQADISGTDETIWNQSGSYSWTANHPGVHFSADTHKNVSIEADDWGEYKIYYRLETVDGCITGDTAVVRFHPMPTSGFVFEDDAKCEGYSKKLIFTGSATDSAYFDWDLDGCQFVDTIGPRQYNISVGAFLNVQPYIRLVIDDNGCVSDTTVKPLGAKPNFIMDADATRGCDKLSVNFTSELITEDNVEFVWTFHNGDIVKEQNVARSYPEPGYYGVTLTITNPVTLCQNGFTLDSMIKVFPTPVAEIVADTSLCYADSALLVYPSAIDSSICSWSFDGGHQSGTGNDSIFMQLDQPFSTATLIVNEYGCFSEPASLTLKRKPNFDFEVDRNEGCQPYSPLLTALPLDNELEFYWISDSLPYPQGDAAIYYLPDSGRADVGLIARSLETGCPDTLIKNDYIWVHPKPVSLFEVDYPVALIEHADITFTNYSELANAYTWDFGDLATSNEINPMHTYNELGEFLAQLYVESEFGCKDTTEFLIKILPFNVFTPNAFRPDSEIAENRTFMPVGVGADMSRFRLKIFDRWGQLVFETDTPENPWDGTTKKGTSAPMGNYVWISHFYDVQGYEHNQKGQVILIR